MPSPPGWYHGHARPAREGCQQAAGSPGGAGEQVVGAPRRARRREHRAVLVLVLGGTRSGKSEVAERLASRLPEPVTYVATGSATDPAMAARIRAHLERRPATWQTVEAGADLPGALARLPAGTVLVDALGTWVAAHHDLRPDPERLLAALRARRGDTVVVSEEVGLSVHPVSEVARRFVDALGDVNRAVAELADEVLLVVAGRVLPLDRFPEP